MASKIKLLFVDDDQEFLHSMTERLKERGLAVWSFDNGTEALALEDELHFDVALLDLELPRMMGGELLVKLKQKDPLMEVVILTGHGSIESAAECTRKGAFSYLLKPCSIDEIITSITQAFTRRVKAKSAKHAVGVQEVMAKAFGLSPIELLEELRKLDRE